MDSTTGFPTTATDGAPSGLSGRSAESVFLAHLPAIDRCCAILSARHGLTATEAEDFAGWVRLRLIENDYAVLRKFGGRSSLQTYLAVVVANLLRDYRVARHGRWRPSAAARRLGTWAERLERLVYRHGLAFREAVAVVRSEGLTDITDREIATQFERIPVRLPLRPEPLGDDATLAALTTAESADAALEAEAERRERAALRAALARALDALPAEDRLILRMRFWDDITVADIARGLGIPQKPLYRRIERDLDLLRDRLLAEGVRPEQISTFLRGDEPSAGDFAPTAPSNRTGSNVVDA